MSGKIDYCYRQEENLYIVWIAGVNRYVQLLEPAWFVFSRFAENLPEPDIIRLCEERYSLPHAEAVRFTREITSRINDLLETEKGEDAVEPEFADETFTQEFFSAKYYRIGGLSFRFNYSSAYIEAVIHPQLQHLGCDEVKSAVDHTFDLISSSQHYCLKVDNRIAGFYPVDNVGRFDGATCLQLIHLIHGKEPGDWMGVAHASAITDGREAVLFVAPSGGGKSTIAALMMASGFKLLSDDFVPVAMTEPELYSFPVGISVKYTAIPFLTKYFPELSDYNNGDTEKKSGKGIYLPFPGNSLSLKNVKTRAVVFVTFDKEVACQMKRESNAGMMNDFLRETWIVNSPESAVRFMEWYFNMKIYSLRYSDNEKAIAAVKKIFGFCGH